MNIDLQALLNLIAAAGALGTAAFGLVDASKSVAGGMSNPGFGYVKKAIENLLPADAAGYGRKQVLETLRANWLNGVAKADQKAAAKSLIRLGLTAGNAARLAAATGINAEQLVNAATSIAKGAALTQQDMNVLGQFEAVLGAILDQAYERGDQFYRNSAKVAAGIVSVILAVTSGALLFQPSTDSPSYLGSADFLRAILIGLVATPLAPMAKDLTTSLSAAAKAVSAAKG